MDLDELGKRIARFLSTQGFGPDVIVRDMAVLTGGYSLDTVRFTAVTGTSETRLVLRADPRGDAALTHTDRSREWELLEALTNGSAVPIPAARCADLSGDDLGTRGIVAEYIDGPQLLGHLQTVDPAEYHDHARKLAEAIGAVHNEGADIAPDSFERPPSWDSYIDGLIEEWRKVEASLTERNPFIRWLTDWLDDHRPPPAPLTLVHGEFQAGNVMIDADGEFRIIDWEYAHIGDPRIDLGWAQQVAAFAPPDLIGTDPQAFCARYRKVTGLTEDVVNPLTIAWFSLLGGYRSLGGVLHGLTAMAAGENHLLTSAYLVSAMPFTHRMWREGTKDIEAAMTATNARMEAAR